MFQPTHILVSRSKRTPVQLIPAVTGCKLLTEQDWQTKREPMFELRARQGFFCLGIPVVGYSLQPLDISAPANTEGEQATWA